MVSMSLNFLVKLFNYTYKGLSAAKNPFGKLVRIVFDDMRSLPSMLIADEIFSLKERS